MSVIMKCIDICKEYGDKTILKSINLEVKLGEKIGIVGENGVGKTTLVNIITGNTEMTSGEIVWYKKNVKIGYMKQTTDYDDLARHLSGGERTKAVLKKILYGEYNFLILDEPTNHLDFEGVQWVIKEINKFKGTVLIISHDRYFLNSTIKRIVEVEDKSVANYNGNYSDYRNKKNKDFKDRYHAYVEQEKNKKRINEQIEELKSWSNKAHKEAGKKAIETGNKKGGKQFNRAKAKRMDSRIKSKIKRLAKMQVEGIEKPKEESTIVFKINNAKKVGSVVLEGKNISKAFGKKVLFNNSCFYVKQGEKVAIYGSNGCGKSTLVKAILGQITIDGEIKISNSKKIGYISQEVIDLPENVQILDLFKINNREELGKLRSELALMGFNSESLSKYVKNFSLGQRMKLKLLLMIREEHDILILDEPTNHIDLHVREQLEDALQKYNGTIILVTHDRYMMEKVCNKLLLFENQQIKRLEYNFQEYWEKNQQHKLAKFTDGKLKEKLILDNRLACIISELSITSNGNERYKELEEEYNKLLEEKKDLQ